MGQRTPPPINEPGATEQAFDQVLWESELRDARIRWWAAELWWAFAGLVSVYGIFQLVW